MSGKPDFASGNWHVQALTMAPDPDVPAFRREKNAIDTKKAPNTFIFCNFL